MARSGKLGVSRSMMERAAAELPLEALGLLHHLWSDLRWTPARKIIQGWAWDIRAGQAVVFIAAYAEKFRTSRRRITALLDQLVAGGWFAVEKTHRGCLLTCLRDPRDEDGGEPGPGGGGCDAPLQPPPPAAAPPEPGGVESPCSNPVATLCANNCCTPGCSTPPRAAVSKPGSCKTGARARVGVSPRTVCRAGPAPVGAAATLREAAPVASAGRSVPVPMAIPPPILALAGRQLALAAEPAGVPVGLVAALVLEHPGREAELLAWLLALARRQGRFRAPAAMLRWALARRLAAPGADHDAARRALRGELGADHRARALARSAAELLPDARGRTARERWREAAQARAALNRAAAFERLRKLLPALAGAERAAAERFLARAG